jgi:hypothetical protein
MGKKLLSLTLLALLLAVLAVDTAAQRPRRPRPGARPASLVSLLPPSDAVVNIDVRRLFAEAFPGVVAGDAEKQAHINMHIDQLKSQTGIDVRTFDQLAIGLRYTYPAPGITKVESVALARGKFSAATLVAAGRVTAQGRFAEQKYKGATIYVFSLNDQIRLFGAFDLRLNDVAVSLLNANTLAMGTPANVRAAIDAQTGKKISAEVAALAQTDPTAIIAFGGNVPPGVVKDLRLDSDVLAKDLSGIRQIFGTGGIKGTNFALLLVARTSNPAQAKNLSETVTSVLPLASLFTGRLPAAKKALAQVAVDNLKVVTQGNDLRITIEVPQASLAALIR